MLIMPGNWQQASACPNSKLQREVDDHWKPLSAFWKRNFGSFQIDIWSQYVGNNVIDFRVHNAYLLTIFLCVVNLNT